MDVQSQHSTPGIRRIGSAFSAKAHAYNQTATVQTGLLDSLIDRMGSFGSTPNDLWLDCGCGTGYLESAMQRRGLALRVVGIDVARGALTLARRSNQLMPVVADIGMLPFSGELFSGAIMTSVAQWLPDPHAALAGVSRVLRQEAPFFFAVFLEGSFRELVALRSEWGLSLPTVYFRSGQWPSLLRNTGFGLVESSSLSVQKHYLSAALALRSMSGCGASATAGPGLSRARVREFCRAYEDRFTTSEGVAVSYEVLLGVARKGSVTSL